MHLSKKVFLAYSRWQSVWLFYILVGFFILSATEKSNACDKPGKTKSNDFISVFLDFPYHNQFIRESLPVINYVRDRQMSQVHIKINRQHSGAAGENYVISLIGRQKFEGMNNEITYWAPAANSDDDTRRALVERLKLGLGPYLANSNLNGHITVNINDSLMMQERTAIEDPWKNWVIELYGGGNYYEEATQSKFSARWGVYAQKVSEDWKIRVRPYFNINESSYESGDNTVVSENYRHGFDGYMIRSLGQHWSTGLFVDMLASTFHNMKYNIEASPAIEYSLFPYSDATEKAVTFVYLTGASRNYYLEKTIFLKEQETLWKHGMKISVRFDQTWGSIRGGVSGSHYFHDFDANRLELYSRLDLRLIKGLSLSFNGNLDLTNDLMTIPAGDASLEEILLQERAQSTSYQIYSSVGLAYRFGSESSNVVNTRF